MAFGRGKKPPADKPYNHADASASAAKLGMSAIQKFQYDAMFGGQDHTESDPKRCECGKRKNENSPYCGSCMKDFIQ
jgi:hypothetical protein